MTTVPTNLENPGVQPKSLRTDNFGYVQYPKSRNAGSSAYDKTTFNGAVNISLTPQQMITLITIEALSTFTQLTLPATATLAAYLQRIYSVENETNTGGSFAGQSGKVYFFPLIFDNRRATGTATDIVTLIAGDGNTTFTLGGDTLNRGLTKLMMRFSTAGSPAVASLQVLPDFDGGIPSGPTFTAVPLYAPFPAQDADSIPVWDSSNGNLFSRMTRTQFFSMGTAASNTFAGTGANYGGGATTTTVLGSGAAPTIGATSSNVIIGSTAAPALSTGTNEIIIGNTSAVLLATGSRNIVVGFNTLNNAAAAAIADTIIIGSGATISDAAQTGSIVIGHTSSVGVGAFANTVVIGQALSGAPVAAGSFFVRARNVASANAVTYVPGTNEVTQAASNRYVKRDIQTLNKEEAHEAVMKLRPIKYHSRQVRLNSQTDQVEYFETKEDGELRGFFAEDIDRDVPELAYRAPFRLYSTKQQKDIEIENENFALNYKERDLIAMLVASHQLLVERVKELEARE